LFADTFPFVLLISTLNFTILQQNKKDLTDEFVESLACLACLGGFGGGVGAAELIATGVDEAGNDGIEFSVCVGLSASSEEPPTIADGRCD
jgi:hypothetical protein